VADAKVDRELALAFENALTETIASIAADFDESAPAFMFIQEEDWKWLLPLFPNLARHKIIGKEAVGRRHMLLVANQAGEEAVGAK
jgi:hypothetical protein